MTDKPKRVSIAMRLRNYFLTGLVICAPLVITLYLTWSFVIWVDAWVKPYLPVKYTPDYYLPFPVPGFGLLIALVVITLIGFLTAGLIGRTVIGFGEFDPAPDALHPGDLQGPQADIPDGAFRKLELVPEGRSDRISPQGAVVAGLPGDGNEGRGERASSRGRGGDRLGLPSDDAESRLRATFSSCRNPKSSSSTCRSRMRQR